MGSEIEKLQKEIAELERRGIDLTGRLASARERKAALDADSQALLARLADGDESARKQLRRIEADTKENAENLQAFSAAVTTTAAKLTAAQKTLTRAEEQATVDQLDREIKNFATLDRDLQAALSVVSEKSSALIQAVNAVGVKLTARDERTYGMLAAQLTAQIRRAISLHFQTMNQPNAARQTFSDAVALDLRRIVGELRYELGGRTMTPERGEKLYRIVVGCPGVRDVDARPGDHVALRPDDAMTVQLLKSGTIADADQSAATKEEHAA